MDIQFSETQELKMCKSTHYNSVFNKVTGFFARWGKTKEDDPQYGPYPEILDCEISTTPNCLGKCKFCYKGNTKGQELHNMTLEEFKTIISKFPHVEKNGKISHMLTQIAFGICDVDTNPDFFPMMEYARSLGIIPNYTCNGYKITDEIAKKTAQLCGAVSVSIVNREKSFDAIKKFIDAGMKQVNIHYVFADETFDDAMELVEACKTDSRLQGLNAIVFLLYKPKGNCAGMFHSVKSIEKYRKVVEKCTDMGINFGFDSCSASLFLKTMQNTKNEQMINMVAEPCESGLFSSYINCKGKFFVCSFAEGENEWKEGIDVLNCDCFLKDVWYNDKVVAWREKLIANNRNCPIFDLN